MEPKFQVLQQLGAGEFQHLDGTLVEHLDGTRTLLSEWSAPSYLCDAGLFHAAYGTAAFDAPLVGIEQRDAIAKIIGAAAEEVVYCYCACDRDFFYPQINQDTGIILRDRFTDKTFEPHSGLLQDICELTVANEIQIALDNPEFIKQHGVYLYKLFCAMSPYLSAHAIKASEAIFAPETN